MELMDWMQLTVAASCVGSFAYAARRVSSDLLRDAIRMRKLNELLDRAADEGSGVPPALQKAFQEGSMATRSALDRAIEHDGMPRTDRRSRQRYVVRDRAGRPLCETGWRVAAWFVWLAHRSSGATAHDRFSWIVDDKSWLRCGDMPCQERKAKRAGHMENR
ncbi:hypothetical protein [Burkholderia multivorans]|uniref:hypothetical protein n=1 Tax=Burkholderia multivorans TaxID=87883 RepID=UPI00057E96ED|nr:hypothetical protein [Burkholderia multivorans]KHS09413.1 hypothetical protein BMD20_29510 [Burkholderia multivorans]KHS10391.1 hypothetical protein BMD22_28320 [Burkholderia multivorans]HDR9474395.1 hypothetical protein [Burkholderia multivorans]HDR9480237.1 hypothetical protein [Burkholderia multivorans]